MMKTYKGLVIKLCISLFIIYLVLRNNSLDVVFKFFDLYTFFDISLVILLILIANFVSALRWKLFLPPLSYYKLFKLGLVGQFYGLILPGQIAGEIAKGYRVTKHESIDGGVSLASIIIDKILGLLGLLLLSAFALIISRNDVSQKFLLPNIMLLIMLLSLIIVANTNLGLKILNYFRPNNVIKSFKNKFFNYIESVLVQFSDFSSRYKIIFYSFFLGMLFQFFAILITYYLASVLGINISFYNWFWIFGIITISLLLPISIAGIGVREGLFVYLLMQFGYSSEIAIALSLSILASQIIPALFGGLLEAHNLYKT